MRSINQSIVSYLELISIEWFEPIITDDQLIGHPGLVVNSYQLPNVPCTMTSSEDESWVEFSVVSTKEAV